jgi:carbamoyl-phosphate synthase large subunit
MKPTVLITGIGGDIAQGVATILRECRPDLRLIGSDIHGCHGGKRLVDKVLILPKANKKNYLRRLKTILIKESVRFVIPMTESELVVLIDKEKIFPDLKWISPGRNVLIAGLDKWETIKALRKMKLSGPKTVLLPCKKLLRFPFIMKSRFGSGSRNVKIIRKKKEFIFFSKTIEKPIIQELLIPENKEVTCAVYRTKDGQVACLQMLRRLMGGLTSWAKIINDASVRKICEEIAHQLNLKGSMNIQMRITRKGPRIFEINPRFSSTVFMRHLFGFTDVLWSIAEAEGKIVKFPKIKKTGILVRTHSATIL